MGWWYWLGYWVGVAAAGLGALAHVYFAYLEAVQWAPGTVRKIAPSWLEGLSDADAAKVVGWSKRLAFNIGIYNLVMALGLAWTCAAFATQAPTAKPFGLFFAVWLLGAAAAAIHTQVPKAFKVQGALGVALLVAALLI